MPGSFTSVPLVSQAAGLPASSGPTAGVSVGLLSAQQQLADARPPVAASGGAGAVAAAAPEPGSAPGWSGSPGTDAASSAAQHELLVDLQVVMQSVPAEAVSAQCWHGIFFSTLSWIGCGLAHPRCALRHGQWIPATISLRLRALPTGHRRCQL